jgi:SpoVK/Ycf46/Vps4 family AAA+-type ATPase
MARGEVLRKLFKSFSHNEREDFLVAAHELIDEERSKNHLLLAKDLEKLLHNGNGRLKQIASDTDPWNQFAEPPKDKETGLPLLSIKTCDLTWEQVILEDRILDTLQEVVLENRKQDVLAAYGQKPKNKILFCGPPGCGKTLTAQVMSNSLGLPLAYVNLTAVFSSYLGETATNLQKVFSYVERGEWVVLLDEFDAIARDRNAANEHGEVKRLVNSLLQLIDNAKSDNVYIAATNHEVLLDSAIWRRFDEVLVFNKPSLELRMGLMNQYLSSIRHSDVDLKIFADQLNNATGSDIARICSNAIKATILRGENYLRQDDLEFEIARYMERESIISASINSLSS